MPRGQRARLDSDMCAMIDQSTCLVEPSCSKISHSCFPHVWHHLLGISVLCLHFCLHFGFVRPALEVRTETDLQLLGLLILLSLSHPGSLEPVSACSWGPWQPHRCLAPEEHSRFPAVWMFGTSPSAPSDPQSLCLVTGSVPSAPLGLLLLFQ